MAIHASASSQAPPLIAQVPPRDTNLPFSPIPGADTVPPAGQLHPAKHGGPAVRPWLQHHLNALHLMALCTRLGCPRLRARTLARWWERLAHPWLYGVRR